MRCFITCTALFLTVLVLSSCQKDEVKTYPLSSLMVGNFIVNGQAVKLGSNATEVNNFNAMQIVLNAGENNLYISHLGIHPNAI